MDFSLIADYYTGHHDELVAYLSRRLPLSDDAEDVLHDAFLRIMNSDKLVSAVSLPGLVYTAVKNLVYDRWRHKRVVYEFEQVLQSRYNGESHDTESVFSVREMEALLERGISHLSDSQQVVYRMNIYQGMPVSEISRQLGASYKNVENRLGVARKNVRRYMARMLA